VSSEIKEYFLIFLDICCELKEFFVSFLRPKKKKLLYTKKPRYVVFSGYPVKLGIK